MSRTRIYRVFVIAFFQVMPVFFTYQNVTFATNGNNTIIYGEVDVDTIVTVYELEGNPTERERNIVVSTLEFGVTSNFNDLARADLLLLYEESDDPLAQEILVDQAYITLSNANEIVILTAGRAYVPFGTYTTSHISDPLTLELGEASQSMISLTIGQEILNSSIFAMSGVSMEADSDNTEQWGAAIGHATKNTNYSHSVNISWINSILESNSLKEVMGDKIEFLEEYVPGINLYVAADIYNLHFVAEYLGASEEFDSTELLFNGEPAKPDSVNYELSLDFRFFTKASVIALAYQKTRESLILELPEVRYLATISTSVYDDVSVALEWAKDFEYHAATTSVSDPVGMTGTSVSGGGGIINTYTLQFVKNF